MLGGAYALLTDLAGPPLQWWLRRRLHRGKELPDRLAERTGRATAPRPAGKLAWFHGASVGECLSLLPLIAAVRDRGWSVLVTSGTVTSAALLAERLPAGAVHQFLPLDRRAWIRAFLDHWRPDLVVWAESELWPNTLREIARRRIPAVLVNARLSDRAFAGWRRWPGFARSVLAAFDLVLAQSDLDCTRFAALGARQALVSGNIKLAAPALPADPAVVAALRSAIGARPLWLAASIHPGEDRVAAAVHRALKGRRPGLLTIIVPRHPERGREMAESFTGLAVARRQAGEMPTSEVEVYIADTMGELGAFYRAADLVFVGKSLAVGGGQNPAEPALLGCALVFGPDMSNFRDTAAELLVCGAARQVNGESGLIAAIDGLLADPAARAAMATAGKAAISAHADAVAQTLARLEPYLTGD